MCLNFLNRGDDVNFVLTSREMWEAIWNEFTPGMLLSKRGGIRNPRIIYVLRSNVILCSFYLFIYKQPMMADQGLKRSLATRRLTKIRTPTHTCKTLQTENTVDQWFPTGEEFHEFRGGIST